MGRRWIALSLLALMLTLAACGEASPTPTGTGSETLQAANGGGSQADVPAQAPYDEIVIGFTNTLHGYLSSYGNWSQQGFDLAIEELNQRGGIHGIPVRIIVDDNNSTKEQALADTQKYAQREGTLVAFCYSTAICQASWPLGKQQEMVVIGLGATAAFEATTQLGGDYGWRVAVPEYVIYPHVASYLASKGYRTAVVIYQRGEAFSESNSPYQVEALEAAGFEVLEVIGHDSDAVDFRAELTRALAHDPEVIALTSVGPASVSLMQQARRLGFEGVFFGSNAQNSIDLMQQAHPASVGLFVGTGYFVGNPDPLNQEFVQKITDRHGTPPNNFVAESYTAIHLLEAALKQMTLTGNLKEDRRALVDALKNLDPIDSVLGPIAFDETRTSIPENVLVLEYRDDQAFHLAE